MGDDLLKKNSTHLYRKEALKLIQNNTPDLLDLYRGQAGVLLYLLGVNRKSDAETMLIEKLALELLKSCSQTTMSLSFFQGYWGVWWVLGQALKENHFNKKIRDRFSQIEKIYLTHSLDVNKWRSQAQYGINSFDLTHGITGFGNAFLNSTSIHRDRVLSFVVENLQRNFKPSRYGKVWFNADQKTASTGLAHGQAGIILLLSKIYKETKSPQLYELISEAANPLVIAATRSRLEFLPRVFGSRKRNTSTWCHGDLGIGYALIKSGHNIGNPSLADCGFHLVARSQRTENYVLNQDIASLCHGALINQLIFRSLDLPLAGGSNSNRIKSTVIDEARAPSLFFDELAISVAAGILTGNQNPSCLKALLIDFNDRDKLTFSKTTLVRGQTDGYDKETKANKKTGSIGL